jgi:hypothetical protein
MEAFKVVDQQYISPLQMREVRRRLGKMCGEPKMIRLIDYDHAAREVWESPEKQRFTMAYHFGRYSLQEITFDDAAIIPLNPPS